MKKKILAVALAGALAVGGGVLLTGCGEDQSKLHDAYRSANTTMLNYKGSCSYSSKEDGRLDHQRTFNHLTGEFAYINYEDDGSIEYYSATKYFDETLAYINGHSDRIVDIAYAQDLAKDEILRRAYDKDIDIDYSQYKQQLDNEAQAFKQDILEEGGKINKIAFKVSYSSLGNEKYNAKLYTAYDFQILSDGNGSRQQYEVTSNIVFSMDWIHSVETSYFAKYTPYQSGVVVEDEVECDSGNELTEYFKTYDASIYSKLDFSNVSCPTTVQHTYLNVVLDGVKVRGDEYVPFNIDVKTEIEQMLPSQTGMAYEFYLDEALTMPMPHDYQLNSVEDNTIYLKTVILEGYALLTEVYQDTTGIRGTDTKIIALGEAIELHDFYNYQAFSNKMLIDGVEVTPCDSYTFDEGKTHTIVYIATHNVDEVVQNDIWFYVGEVEYGFTISAGTPGDQTLREFIQENEILFRGVDIRNDGFELEVSSPDGSEVNLDMKLCEFVNDEYFINLTAKTGYVFVQNEMMITTQEASETGITITFNKSYMTLIGVTNGFPYEYTQFETWFAKGWAGDLTVEIEEEGNIVNVTITGTFDDSLLYQFYYGERPF